MQGYVNLTKGKPIPPGGYIDTESQSEVSTKNVQRKGGLRTNDQTKTLPDKGIRCQQS